MTARDTITLKAMRFQASVGAYPHEREFTQPVEIDLSVEIDRGANQAIVDYAQLYDDVAKLMASGHIEYIETIAERIAELALARPGVMLAQVAVRKPHVALPGPLAYAEIRIVRSHDLSA